MVNAILDTLYILVKSSSILLGFITVLYLLQRLVSGLFLKLFGRSYTYLSATIGVPIHELSHWFLCLLGGHKVTSVRLLKSPKHDGVFGYVTHSYNRNSLYQEAMNFPIGIAPLFGGVIVIALLTKLMLPASNSIFDLIYYSASSYRDVSGVVSFVSALHVDLNNLISILGEAADESPQMFYIWAYLTAAISLHLSPSPADMKGALKGGVIIVLLLTVLRWGFSWFEKDFTMILENFLISISMVFSLCILMSLSLALLMMMLALVMTIIRYSIGFIFVRS